MKNSFLIVVASLLIVGISDAGAKKKFGKEISLKEMVKISTILADPEKYNGKKVLVEGSIIDVCKERGCWIKIGSDKEFESIRFKVDDGVIVFPLDIKGKQALAEGIISVKTLTKEQLIKRGEEAAKEEGTTFDASKITTGQTTVILKGEGAIVEVE